MSSLEEDFVGAGDSDSSGMADGRLVSSCRVGGGLGGGGAFRFPRDEDSERLDVDTTEVRLVAWGT